MAKCTSTSPSSLLLPPTSSAMPMARTASRLAARWASRWLIPSTPTASSSSPTTSCRSPACPWQIQGNNVDYVVRSRIHRRSREDRQRHHPDHAQPRPPAHLRTGRAIPARQRHHARRLFLPGGRRRNRAGLRRLPGAHDAAGRRQGQLRARRLDQVPGRHVAGRPDRLHPRRPDLRSRCGALHRERSAARARPSPSLRTTFTARETSLRWSMPASWAQPRWT